MKYTPKYDKGFMPAVIELEKFRQSVKKSKDKKELIICLERTRRCNYIYKIDIFADNTGHDDENLRVAERIIKTLLWIVGGFKIYIAGSDKIYKAIKKAYSPGGSREFDCEFMSGVYESKFQVVSCEYKDIPELKEEAIKFSKNSNGNRIGFDAGGSDRKVSAVVDGQVKFSDETVWFPKINSDPNYHFSGILDSIEEASKYMDTIDAIGVSSAGIVVDNRMMVASLFLKVPKEEYDAKVKNIYLDINKYFEDKLGKKIPIVVANDGDVTALAGAMQLNSDKVLGIAMGTSEAAGYVGEGGKLEGWLNELAFAPVDFSKDAMEDEWSFDIGCGVKYFSQDGVIKLAGHAGIKFEEGFSPARKLKYVQDLLEQGDERAHDIYQDIGTYLGYTLAYYAEFYEIKHVLLLGRVVSGKGGNLLLEQARTVLRDEFPSLASQMVLGMPDSKSRRVGQSITAAFMPTL